MDLCETHRTGFSSKFPSKPTSSLCLTYSTLYTKSRLSAWRGSPLIYLQRKHHNPVSLFEGGDKKQQRLIRRCDGGLFPAVNQSILFVENSKDVLVLLTTRSNSSPLSASASLFSHTSLCPYLLCSYRLLFSNSISLIAVASRCRMCCGISRAMSDARSEFRKAGTCGPNRSASRGTLEGSIWQLMQGPTCES